MSPEQKKKLVELQSKLALASIALPSPLGDAVGLGSDALGYYSDPSQRTPLNGLLSLASVLPFVPSSAAAKAAIKDMPSFKDQMKMVRTVLKGKKSAEGATLAATLPRMDALFDAEKGIGQTPNNLDIEKIGRVEHMTPDQYLSLAEKLPRPSESSLSYIKEGISKGKKLGQPTLTVDKGRVVNHDGRHRSMVMKELFGEDVLIPVHVIGDKTTPVAALKPQATDEAFQRVDALLQARKDRKRTGTPGALDQSGAFMEMLQRELNK